MQGKPETSIKINEDTNGSPLASEYEGQVSLLLPYRVSLLGLGDEDGQNGTHCRIGWTTATDSQRRDTSQGHLVAAPLPGFEAWDDSIRDVPHTKVLQWVSIKSLQRINGGTPYFVPI